MIRRPAACLAALLALTGLSAAPRPAVAADEVVLALPALNMGFATSYIAEDMGFWTKRDLKVKIVVISGIGAMNAVFSTSADFSNSSGQTIIRAKIRGRDVLTIANSFTGLIHELVVSNELAKSAGVTLQSPLEKRIAALRGKKIAINAANAIPHGILRVLVRKGGLDPERDITVAIMAPEASIAAIKSGAIDGMVQSLPWSLIPPRQGIGITLASNLRGKPDLPEYLPMVFNGIVTRPEFCKDKPSICERMTQGYTDALNYMHSHPKESVALLNKRLAGSDPELTRESYDLMLHWTPKDPRMTDEGWAKAQDLMVAGGMIKASEKLTSFKDIYTNQYIK
jgi:ABC-type nitrate/sulfonate/bicarbonate transport system substrate-binding protein